MRVDRKAGTAHVERWVDTQRDCVDKYNLNYIDENIGSAQQNFQVIGRHYGHDHGFGICHLHRFDQVTKNLGDSCSWLTCATSFVNDVYQIVMTHYNFVPEMLTVPNLEEILDANN